MSTLWSPQPLWSLLAIPALLLIVAILHFTAGPAVFYDPPWLILTGNTLFIGAVGFAVARIAWRNYVAAGQIQVLLLGCAMLLFGIGGVLAGLVRGLTDGANVNVTIYNVGALAGGVLHSVAALILLAGVVAEARPARRKLWLTAGYGGAVLFMALLAVASFNAVIPPFFLQGAGPSPLRQQVLGSADLLFVFSFLIFMAAYIRNREPFLYWYAGGLALTAISLTAFYIQYAVGSPVGWAGRCAQYLGGIYFLLSLIITERRAQRRGASFDDVLTASLTGAQEKFRAAFANAPIGFALTAPSGRYLDANPAYCALTGYSVAELRSLAFPLLVHPGEHAASMEQTRRMLAGELPDFTTENRYVRKGGQPVWVRKSVSLVRDPDGEPCWFVSLVEDITERKQAEEKLHRSEQVALELARDAMAARAAAEEAARTLAGQRAELQLILDATPASIFYKDRENCFVRVNRAFAENMGAPKEELEGRSTFDIYPREQAEAYWRDDKEVMASGHPKLNIVEPMQSPAGELWMRTGKVPCRDPDGNIIGVIGFAVDITDSLKAEEALRESEERLRSAIEGSEGAEWQIPADETQQHGFSDAADISPQSKRFIGFDADEFPNSVSAWRQRIHPDDLLEITEAARAHIEKQIPFYNAEYRIRHKDGSWRYILSAGRLQRDSRGQPLRWVGVDWDITEQKRREQQVQLLMNEVNHRAKNLLSVVQAVASQTAKHQPAAFVERFTERLQSLAVSQDLLVKCHWQGIGIDELVRSQLAHFKDLIDGRVTLQGPRLALTAKAAQSIGMALHELATNASKYGALSNASGRVTIGWELAPGAPEGGRFALSWIERGGPPAEAPKRRGFGSTIIQTLPAVEFDAEVALDYAPEGLSWRMNCPADRVLEPVSAQQPAVLLAAASAAEVRLQLPVLAVEDHSRRRASVK